MPLNKKQLKRLVLFVGELKKNRYPNSYSFAEYLEELEFDENINIKSSPRTIQRDIRVLKEDFDAPLEYDPEKTGYYLTKPYWEFTTPILSDIEMLSIVLGGRIAETILPDSKIRSQLQEAVAQQLTTNSNDLFETTYLDSLMVFGHMHVDIDGVIFQTVFDAWRNNEAIDIEYVGAQEYRTSRRIDPHILAFRDGAWFLKAYCHRKEAFLTFSVHRIKTAVPTGKYFEHDKKLNEKTRNDGIFGLQKVEDVLLRCENRIINYARDYKFHPDQTIKPVENDKFELYIPSAERDELVRWIMWQAGQAAVLKPKKLKEDIKGYGEKIFKNN